MHIYLYNLKNPLEFEKKQAKPIFEEVGPFIYKESRAKDNIVDNRNYTISYSDRRYYNFLPDISPFKEDHQITTVNMAAVVIAKLKLMNKENQFPEPCVVCLLLT
jgi:scavenger receptor class B protein 1